MKLLVVYYHIIQVAAWHPFPCLISDTITIHSAMPSSDFSLPHVFRNSAFSSPTA